MPRRAVTVAAPATPSGRGGIAAILVTGPDAETIVNRVFRPRGPERGGVSVGHVLWRGDVVDEAVLLRFPAGEGAEPRLEIDVHGGRGSVAAVMAALAEAGAAPLSTPSELRAFLASRGDIDAIQAEAEAALEEAATIEAAAFFAAAASGRLSAEIERLAASLEAREPGAAGRLERLAAGAAAGMALARPRSAVLCGRPNAGKSTLMNAVAGASLSITSDLPNTTRDAVDAVVALSGWPVHLVDTAGLGTDPGGEVERLAARAARRALAVADVAVLVVDGSAPIGEADDLAAALPGGVPAVVAVTRADLEPAFGRDSLPFRGTPSVRVSGVTGEGLESLFAAIVAALSLPPRPPRGPGLFTERQAEAARAAVAASGGGATAEAASVLRALFSPAHGG